MEKFPSAVIDEILGNLRLIDIKNLSNINLELCDKYVKRISGANLIDFWIEHTIEKDSKSKKYGKSNFQCTNCRRKNIDTRLVLYICESCHIDELFCISCREKCSCSWCKKYMCEPCCVDCERCQELFCDDCYVDHICKN